MTFAPLLLALLAGADGLASLPPAPAGGLRVYLVRHGQALSNLDPTPDLPKEQLDHLTDLGRLQADAAGRLLAKQRVAAVMTSPASRARETAERLAAAVGAATPVVETPLRPLDLGTRADGTALDWDDREADWEAGRDPSPPGGESMEQMSARVADLVAGLAGKGGPRRVVLVAHGEVIGSYLGRLRGTPPAKRYPPNLANASISVVDVAADGTANVVLANHKPEP
jgi:ribonuclease H / adenosylcobalamin/alpha-ribazole phosphatase